jgi:hypothetical protein
MLRLEIVTILVRERNGEGGKGGGGGCCLFHHWNTGKNPSIKQVNKSSEDVAMFNFLEIKMLKGIWNNKLTITQAYSEHKVF